MIHLFNHSGLPNKPIKDILTWAARKVGVSGDIAVKVNRGRFGGVSGEARSGWPYLDWLKCKPGKKRTKNRKMHKAGPGYYEIVLPNFFCKTETERKYKQGRIISDAIRFVEVALHETAHVFQGRNHLGLKCPTTSSGRRIAWAKRPAEIDAENREYEVLQSPANKVRADDLALALALAMEEKK